MNKFKINNHKSFLFPLILNTLNLPDDSEGFIQYVVAVIILSLIALSCFFNGLAYLAVNYGIKHYSLEEKYPKLKRIINYYKNTNFGFAIFEFVLGFISLIILFIFSLLGL
jgi:hypothetical protein